MRFQTTVQTAGKSATGLLIPDEVVAALGAGKRPAVRVTVGSHTYRSTIASMGGRYLIALSAENRTAAGVAGGDTVDVELELDEAPREVEMPADLAQALAADSGAQAFFDGLSFTYRKEWARWITEAKKPETRAARVAKAVTSLAAGQKTH